MKSVGLIEKNKKEANTPNSENQQSEAQTIFGLSRPAVQLKSSYAPASNPEGHSSNGHDAESATDKTHQSPFSIQPSQRKEKSGQQNNSGLSDNLKSGIENLSGQTMDDVKVHYNSDKPFQLNANAFAQGSDIYLGPGQEKHLPHEAWHVVQQKEERVKGTIQTQLPEENSLSLQDRAPVQRRVFKHRSVPTAKVDKATIKKAKQIAQLISDIVDRVRPIALDWRQFSSHDGYLGNWYKNANEQYQLGGNGDVDFLHASFGYAVETLACQQLNNVEFGLHIGLQVASGHTRPDVEVRDDDDNIVAWMDITTNAEKNHVNRKTGNGWKTHPYVCEILYPSLESNEVFTASDHPFYSQEGKLLASKAENRRNATEDTMFEMHSKIYGFQEEHNQLNYPGGNQTHKQKAIKTFMNEEFGEDFGGSKVNQSVNSTLNQLGFNPGHFGFKNAKQSSAYFNSYVRDTSQPDIDQRNSNLFQSEHEQVNSSLYRYQYSPQMQGFQQSWQQAEETQKEEQLRKEYMIKACINMAEELKAALFYLKTISHVAGVNQKVFEITQQLFTTPYDGDINKGNTWIAHAKSLMDWVNGMKEYYQPKTSYLEDDNSREKNMDEDYY